MTPLELLESDGRPAVRLPRALEERKRTAWLAAVYRAKKAWIADFGGEQFSLGRAFYTHYETSQSKLYFEDAAASDARVEKCLPRMQAWALDLFATCVGGTVRRRLGFCGPGVHLFPAGGNVAKSGGVVHYDVEGLTPLILEHRHRALSLVVMLQTPERGGGLKVWGTEYNGTEAVTDDDLETPNKVIRYRDGDGLLMSSYRLHQIRPFSGPLDRVSITLHALEVDRGVWEIWF